MPTNGRLYALRVPQARALPTASSPRSLAAAVPYHDVRCRSDAGCNPDVKRSCCLARSSCHQGLQRTFTSKSLPGRLSPSSLDANFGVCVMPSAPGWPWVLPPRAPTDPDVRISRIRLVRRRGSLLLRRRCVRCAVVAARTCVEPDENAPTSSCVPMSGGLTTDARYVRLRERIASSHACYR